MHCSSNSSSNDNSNDNSSDDDNARCEFCCSNRDCQLLHSLLVALLGTEWRAAIFANDSMPIDTQQYDDEVLLMSLANAKSSSVLLLELLRQRSKQARMANRLVCAWWYSKCCRDFPSDVAAAVLRCSQELVSNRFTCRSPYVSHRRPIPTASAFGLYFVLGLLFGLLLRRL